MKYIPLAIFFKDGVPAIAFLQKPNHPSMFNQLFSAHSVRSIIRVMALVLMLLILVNIF
jgi:hypothetical protein